MQIGSPKGAVKLKRTTVPGKHPISMSLTDNCSSVNPETIATSPGRISATFFIRPDMLFRLILNKANIKVVPMLSNQLSSFELVGVNNSFLEGKLPMSKKKKAADKQAPKDKPAKSQ